jgi:hypothetical protein
MERQRFLALHHSKCKGCAAILSNNQTIGRLSRPKWLKQHRYYVVKMSVNGTSTIFGFAL